MHGTAAAAAEGTKSFFIDTTGVQLDIPPDIYFGPAKGAHQRSSCISLLGYHYIDLNIRYYRYYRYYLVLPVLPVLVLYCTGIIPVHS
eukprot:COSAG05_NODE_14_length_36349_cov_27.641655_25_plen_88_part_00